MDLLTDNQVRLLAFIEACNQSAYRPRAVEVEAWLASPTARPPATRFNVLISTQVSRSLGQIFAAVPGTGETYVEHAVRLFWLVENDGLLLTTLGRALLNASKRQQSDQLASDVVILNREDPLAYATLIGRLASFGSGLLVDPYLRLEQLHDLCIQTPISRILISKQYKNSTEVRASMAIYLGGIDPTRRLEVRCSADDDVHDRMVMTPTGETHLLGYSLNGVESGVASTLLIKLPQPAATAQAEKIEDWWAAAELLRPAEDHDVALPAAPAKKSAAAAAAKKAAPAKARPDAK